MKKRISLLLAMCLMMMIGCSAMAVNGSTDISFEGKTYHLTFEGAEVTDGKLVISVGGYGSTIAMRNNAIVIVARALAVIDGETIRATTTTANATGIYQFEFDTDQMPETILIAPYEDQDSPVTLWTANGGDETADETSVDGIPDWLVGTWNGTGIPENGGPSINLTVTVYADGTGEYGFEQNGYTESNPISISAQDNTFTVTPAETSQLGKAEGTWSLTDNVLTLHITSTLPSGRIYSYTAECARAETSAPVSTPEELTAALSNDAITAVEIIADMTITSVTEDVSFVLSKDVTIAEGANVVFQPAPDDGFFVKSLLIPEGVTLTIKGSLTTMSTFEGGFAIAQVYLNGGTLDVSEGAVSEDCNICFNAGTLIAPEEDFGEGVSVTRYLYEDVTDAAIADALDTEGLRTVAVQADCTLHSSIAVPEGKTLQISAFVTVADGASLTGNVIVDADCGLILMGRASLNDVLPDEGTAGCILTWSEDTGYVKTPCDADGNAFT